MSFILLNTKLFFQFGSHETITTDQKTIFTSQKMFQHVKSQNFS